MASDAVKRILEAESASEKKLAEARKQKEQIINDAQGRSSLTIQKKISDAAADAEKLGKEYSVRLAKYNDDAEHECEKKLAELKKTADKNMDKAVDAVIERFF